MTALTILVSALIAAIIWPSMAAGAFRPGVGERLNGGSNLDDVARFGFIVLGGWTTILLVSLALALVIL